MRLNAQSNQFIFQLPSDFIDKDLHEKFKRIIDNNHMPYNDILDYLNSSIKEIVFPSMSFDSASMVLKYGKNVEFKEAGNITDKFQNELDITFRAVDSYMNYFMLIEIFTLYYMNNRQPYIPSFTIQILDKHRDLIYTLYFKDILLKSISEQRLSYNSQDISEKTFSITFRYNWLDIIWELRDKHLDDTKSMFDIDYDKGNKDIEPHFPNTKKRLKNK